MRKLARSAPQTDNAEDQKVLIAVRIAFYRLIVQPNDDRRFTAPGKLFRGHVRVKR